MCGVILFRHCPGGNPVDFSVEVPAWPAHLLRTEDLLVLGEKNPVSELKLVMEAGHSTAQFPQDAGGQTKRDFLGGFNSGFTYQSRHQFLCTFNSNFLESPPDDIQFTINNRFPLYYPEKRPFFLDVAGNADNLAIPLFHTRNIVNQVLDFDGHQEIGGSNILDWQTAFSHSSKQTNEQTGAAWRLAYTHSGPRLTFTASQSAVSPSFAADSGYIPRKDFIRNAVEAEVALIHNESSDLLKKVTLGAAGTVFHDFQGRPTDESLLVKGSFQLPEHTWCRVQQERRYTNYGGKDFDAGFFSVIVANNRFKWLNGRL